jgi:hypothetical protein
MFCDLTRSEKLLDEIREAVRRRSIRDNPDQIISAAASAIVKQAGNSVRAILFFGSRKTGARPDPHSPWDFLVIVEDYREFYYALEKAGALHRSPALLWRLSRIMPPNVIALRATAAESDTNLALKCPVFSLRDFVRETSGRRRDHFLLGRLFQPAEIVYADDSATIEKIVPALAAACLRTFQWGRPGLPERFTAAAYCRVLLRLSFAAEIRPEPQTRTDVLWEAQRDLQLPLYTKLLAGLEQAGQLNEPEPGAYGLAHPVGWMERVRWACYFRWSMVRSTARWAKHVITYQDWLDFVVRKARRHSGLDIVLTPRESRFPLVFLWPRVFSYLREMKTRRVA